MYLKQNRTVENNLILGSSSISTASNTARVANATILRLETLLLTTGSLQQLRNNGSAQKIACNKTNNWTESEDPTNLVEIPETAIEADNSFDRVMDEVIVSILMSVSFYLVVVTVLYNVKHAEKKLKWTNILCCLSAFAILFETSWFQFEILFVFKTDVFCLLYSVVNVTMATSNRTIIYAVFWIRQRSFYRGIASHSSRKRRINLMSNCLLAVMVFLALTQITTLSVLPFQGDGKGCSSGKPSKFLKVFTPVLFSVIALFQLFLLIPVLYPVIKHIHAARRGQSSSRLGAVVIRLSVCSSTCLLTDVLFLAVSTGQPKGSSFSFIPICYAGNTVINVIAMLASFADYKQRLLPCVPVWNRAERSRVRSRPTTVVT